MRELTRHETMDLRGLNVLHLDVTKTYKVRHVLRAINPQKETMDNSVVGV